MSFPVTTDWKFSRVRFTVAMQGLLTEESGDRAMRDAPPYDPEE